jgi:peptidoglycan/LPS O-acetylase OafA/YrhL
MSHTKIRTDIQALRSIAVIAVIIAHSKIGLAGGFVGVDIFFVISGFLITLNILKEVTNTGTISLNNFYAKRTLRILPAASFTIICTFIISLFFLSPVQLLSNLYDGIFSVFSLLNFRLAVNGTNYFTNTEAISPFQHFWSLCIEEQFYLIWPALILFSTKLFSKKYSIKNILNVVLLLIITVSLFLSYFVTQSSPSWAYFGLHTRAWELAIGCFLAVNIGIFERINLQFSKLLSLIGLSFLFLSFYFINESTSFPGLWGLLPTVGTAIIIISGTNLHISIVQKIFASKPLQFIGNISYSWYLVHWPIFVAMFYIYGKDLTFGEASLGIIFSFAVAIFSYYFIENPFRTSSFFKNNIKKTFKFSLITISLIAILFSLTINATNKSKIVPLNYQIDDIETLDKKIKIAVTQNTIPVDLQSKLSQIGGDKYPGCFSERATPVIEEEMVCNLGDTNSAKVVVMIGDSHAWQWTKAWSNIAALHNFKLITFTKSSCPMQDIQKNYTACVSWKEMVFDRISQIKPSIIIAGGMTYSESTPENYQTYINKIKQLSSRVIVMQDTPYPTLNVPECLAKNLNNIQNCSFERKNAYFASTQRDQDKDIATKSGLRVIDPFDWFCSDKICPPIIDNNFVYFDVNHISTAYANYITKLLDEKVKDGFK